MEVTTPLRDFPGVGDARAKGLERLGLRTAGDLTAYFPRGYEDRREQYTIAAAPLDVPVCIPVLLAEEPRRMNIRRGLDVTRMKVVDGASAMLVTFFNQGYVRQALHRGEEYILYGKVEQMPSLEGKKMFLYITPKKAGVAKKSQQKRDRERIEADAKVSKVQQEEEQAEEKGGLFANVKGGGDILRKLKESNIEE